MSAYVPTFVDGSFIGTLTRSLTNSNDYKYVNEYGDMMHGTLNMNNQRLINVSNPENNNDVTNKEFCDKSYMNVNGDKMYGTLDMNNHRLINVMKPENNNDVTNKQYCDNLYKILLFKIENLKRNNLEIHEFYYDIKNQSYTKINLNVPYIEKNLDNNELFINVIDATRKKSYYILHVYLIYKDNLGIDECKEIEDSLSYKLENKLYFTITRPFKQKIMISYSNTNLISELNNKEIKLLFVVLETDLNRMK